MPYSGDPDDAYRKALVEWSKGVQATLGGDVEYIFIPENATAEPANATRPADEDAIRRWLNYSAGGLTHLHGLVYLSRGASPEAKELIRKNWPYGHIDKVVSQERINSTVAVAHYFLKEFDCGDGKLHRPIFASASLRDDIEHDEHKKSRSQKSAQRRRAKKERAFWTSGFLSDEERLAHLKRVATTWSFSLRRRANAWFLDGDKYEAVDDLARGMEDAILRDTLDPYDYNDWLRTHRRSRRGVPA
jgi:hypothetical protein